MELTLIHPEEIGRKEKTEFLFAGFLGFLLNQSNVLFGFNLSLADFVLMLFVIYLFSHHRLHFSIPFLYTIGVFSIVTLINSLFIVPRQFELAAEGGTIIGAYIKLAVIILYFVIGSHLSQWGLTQKLYKGLAIGASVIGIFSVILSIIRIPILYNMMFYGDVRFIGLMNDPNYFSVVQVIAFAYFMRFPLQSKGLTLFFRIVLLISIVSSGSKTGFLTAGAYLVLFLIHTLIENKINLSRMFGLFFFMIVILLFLPYLVEFMGKLMTTLVEHFPIFSRVEMLWENFDEAVSGGGSTRELQWKTAIELIGKAPILGIGIGGNYGQLAYSINGDGNIAHNTYLQMAAEWGTVFTGFILLYIAKLFFAPHRYSNPKTTQLVLLTREMVFIFLVSSLSISFNNSRLFFLLLGILSYYANNKIKDYHDQKEVTT